MSNPNSRHVVRSRLLLGVAFALLVAVVGAIVLAVHRPATDKDVRAIQHLPAYSITYPGAKLLAHVEAPATIPHGGTRGALTVQVFGVPATASVDVNQIFNWYSQQMRDDGWQLASDDTGSWTLICYRQTMDPFLTEYQRQTHGAPTPGNWPSRYTPIFEVVIERTCVP